MRNRLSQPRPLDLPPVEIVPVRIYGQLLGPMGQPVTHTKILLKAITSSQVIVQDTWSESTTDQSGNYDFTVNPGKYAVFFELGGVKTRVNNIVVYSDSAPGNLQSFMLATAVETLTPLMVQEVKASLECATAAMLRARQWAENPVDAPVLDFEEGAGPEYSAYHWAHKAKEMLDTDTNINWRGEWDPAVQYNMRDGVRWRPDASTAYSSYYCMEDNTGTAPPDIATGDNAIWSLMAAGGEQGIPGAPGSDSTVPGPPGPPGADSTVPGPPGPPGAGADMSNYYTKTEVDSIVAGIGGGVIEPGAVGSTAMLTLMVHTTNAISVGTIVAGSTLFYSGFYDNDNALRFTNDAGSSGNSSPAGSWTSIFAYSGNPNASAGGLFVRVA